MRDDIGTDSRSYARLMAEFFDGVPTRAVKDLQGMKIINGVPIFGMAAGPSRSVTHLLHEICHFVEIDEARMCSPMWGLRFPREQSFVSFNGYRSTWFEPKTTQATERELRVFAMQEAMHIYLDVPPIREKVPDLCSFLMDAHLILPGSGKDQKERWILDRFDQIRASRPEMYTVEHVRRVWASRWMKIMSADPKRTKPC